MELRAELRGRSNIQYWAGEYNVDYDTPIKNLVCGVKERGYLTKPELVELACWKLPERWKRGEDEGKLGLVKANSCDDVKEITRKAFRETDSIKSIRCLGRLQGVGRAIGSAILHWFHEERYPIWDIYARWSVRLNECQHQYKNNDERWQTYVKYCKDIADEYEVCMRTLDRALLKYGQANRISSC